ncbi:hypothetical protein BGW80DRAFT_1255930 [Lactifluus volemus]|nr:hypothetical protein BGW80DRAFT_1255930 [Lactifluus volemus]
MPQPHHLTCSYAIANLTMLMSLSQTSSQLDSLHNTPMNMESADVEVALPKTANAVGKYQNLPLANPGAPDMKCPKWPTSEVQAALECKKELSVQLKALEKAKVETMVAIEVDDMLSDSLGSEDKEEEVAAAARVTDDTLDYLSNKEVTLVEIESEGEDESEDQDQDQNRDENENEEENKDEDNRVIMIVTASKKNTKKAIRTKKPAKGEVQAAVDAAIKAGQKRQLVAESAESSLGPR